MFIQDNVMLLFCLFDAWRRGDWIAPIYVPDTGILFFQTTHKTSNY